MRMKSKSKLQTTLSGIQEVLKNKIYVLTLASLFALMSLLFILIPVWTVLGNTLAIQLDIFTVRDYGVLILLSSLSALFITMQIFARQHKKKAGGVSTAAAGGLGALFAGVAGTAFCASCLAPLFSLFGIGFAGTLFVLEYRLYFVVAITLFMLVAIYLTARKINKVCDSC